MTADKPGGGVDPGGLGSMARDLTTRVQDLVERMTRAGQSGGSSASNLTGQFRTVLESSSALGKMPMRQMKVIAAGIENQRRQIHQLQEQLTLFDDQLKIFAELLTPMLEWGEQWGKAQDTMLKHLRPTGKSKR
jgi:hypothetical protein